jgi:hypothetical protein
MTHVSIHAVAQTLEPRVSVRWDGESATLSCRVDHSAVCVEEESHKTLRDEIDQHFGIVPPSYVVTGGMFSLALDSQKRITNWDICSNPMRWSPYTLPLAPARPATPLVEADFDKNGHADDIGEPEIYYDAQHGTIYLSWGQVSSWHAVAQTLAIGVTEDNRLAQIRLEGVRIEPAQQRPAGPWTRWRQRFTRRL